MSWYLAIYNLNKISDAGYPEGYAYPKEFETRDDAQAFLDEHEEFYQFGPKFAVGDIKVDDLWHKNWQQFCSEIGFQIRYSEVM